MATPSRNDLHLIECYLSGRMTPAEVAAFEVRLLEDTELSIETGIIDELRHGMAAELRSLTPARRPLLAGFRSWFSQPLSMAASGIAATAVVVAIAATVQGIGHSGNAITSVNSVIRLEAMRGREVPTLVGSGPYLIQADAGLDPTGQTFTVELVDASSGAVVFRNSAVAASGDGWLRLVVDDALAGEYRLNISTTASDSPAALTYSFVMNPPVTR